jgi:ABC-type methionine transport system ATPase subunit
MSINTLNPNVMESDRPILTRQNRIRIQIPSQYQQEPIISQLASNYHLEISILAAILGANGEGNGWFDLLLTGSIIDINNGLDYLTQLGVEILDRSDQETHHW